MEGRHPGQPAEGTVLSVTVAPVREPRPLDREQAAKPRVLDSGGGQPTAAQPPGKFHAEHLNCSKL